MIETILKERQHLNERLERYYSKLLKELKFSYIVSDSALIDYLERIEFIPISEAKFKILTTVEQFTKEIITQEIEINSIIYAIDSNVIKEITSLTIPLFHKIGYIKGLPIKPFVITPHAILRYLERVCFTNISNCRNNILRDIDIFFKKSHRKFNHVDKLSSWQIQTHNYTLSLKGNVVITIY